MGGVQPGRPTEVGTGAVVRTVRILVDVLGVDREFDYRLPDSLGEVEVGTIVRVPLAGRRVRGWVTCLDSAPPDGVVLKEVLGVVGCGPAPEVIELARWAAWRWAGRRPRFLRTASPERVVRTVPARPSQPALAARFQGSVLRVPPAADGLGEVLPWVGERMGHGGSVLLLVPALERVEPVARRLREKGFPVAITPRGWSEAASGTRVVIGSRAAAWAPAPALSGVVVLDAHDEAYREERAPCWNAVVVAEERARRGGVPFLAVSPCPTVELLEGRDLHTVSRSEERAGWAPLLVVDMGRSDPAQGLYSEQLVRLLSEADRRPGAQVLCVINRRGRSGLIACGSCRALMRCEGCGGPVAEVSEGLRCRVCGTTRPLICSGCGSTSVRRLRPGVSRVAEELSALTGARVEEVWGDKRTEGGPVAGSAVVVGTEAVLHRVPSAGAVAFLDFDRELLAARFGAAEHALSLLARASRVVGGRSARGRVLVQSRMPDHEVISAVLHSDPSIVAADERARRFELGLPPFGALALVSGEGAGEMLGLKEPETGAGEAVALAGGLESSEIAPGRWLVRGANHRVLCDVISSVRGDGGGRLRIEVDPVDV